MGPLISIKTIIQLTVFAFKTYTIVRELPFLSLKKNRDIIITRTITTTATTANDNIDVVDVK
jgi:hypothetical protein